MSTSVGWLKVVEPEPEWLDNDIKYPIARRFMDHDGSLSGEVILYDSDIRYLEGLMDAGNKEVKRSAKILIEAIRKYDKILLVISN